MSYKQIIFREDDELRIRMNGKKSRTTSTSLKCLKARKQQTGSTYDRRQRIYLRCTYTKLNTQTGRRKARLHMEYITREGVGIDGKAPELYGNTSKEELLSIHPNEEHQFRLILSPEYWPSNTGLKLKEFTRSFMKQLSREIGRGLKYTAADHYNTSQPHSHVIIKGVDTMGRPIRFSKDVIRYRFKDIARNTLTAMLGCRNTQIIRAHSQNHIHATRFTPLDQKINKMIKNHHAISNRQINALSPTKARKIEKRLIFLAKKNIITRTRHGFIFSPNWKEILTQCGRTNDFLQALKSIRFNHKSRSHLYKPDRDGAISGHVSYVGVYNEEKVQQFILVEAFNGQNYFCKTSSILPFKKGDLVTYKKDEFHQAGDKILDKYPSHRITKTLKKGKGIGRGY